MLEHSNNENKLVLTFYEDFEAMKNNNKNASVQIPFEFYIDPSLQWDTPEITSFEIRGDSIFDRSVV